MSTSTAEPVEIKVHNYPCVTGGQLRLTYLLSAPDVRAHWEKLHQEHILKCEKCRKYFNDFTAQAIRAVYPEMDLDPPNTIVIVLNYDNENDCTAAAIRAVHPEMSEEGE